ncbi:hypothetical protein ABVK25_008619 [Lepraria finkii]|uniref:V-SNARE coiled-coil homology domain-containing protein n=1 Tax=Lepraria finkii TaxID=1340010 RepID=A0ABR4B0E4_9LECA
MCVVSLPVARRLNSLLNKTSGEMIGYILSEPLSEKPVDVGLEDVQDQTERLLNRVTTLQSMAVQRIDGNLEDVKGGAETIRSGAQHTEKMTGKCTQ